MSDPSSEVVSIEIPMAIAEVWEQEATGAGVTVAAYLTWHVEQSRRVAILPHDVRDGAPSPTAARYIAVCRQLPDDSGFLLVILDTHNPTYHVESSRSLDWFEMRPRAACTAVVDMGWMVAGWSLFDPNRKAGWYQLADDVWVAPAHIHHSIDQSDPREPHTS